MSIRTKGLAHEVNEMLEHGALLTITEWAEKFDVPYGIMNNVFVRLRKAGFSYRPYPGNIRVGVRNKTGVVVDYTKSAEWARQCLDKYEDNKLIPSIDNQFKMIESVVDKHPELAAEMKPRLNKITLKVIEAEERMSHKKLEEAKH